MATATLPPTTTTIPRSPISLPTKSQSHTSPNSPLSPSRSLLKKKTMSITQTYFLAHKARAKLSGEAGRPDHDLRLLVGHANLLDSLMLELADAEREQESWFNQSVSGAAKGDERHIRWADSPVEEPEDDWQAEDADFDSSSDSDSDLDEDEDEDEDIDMVDVPLRRAPSHTDVPSLRNTDYDDMEEDDDEEEDFAQLTLTRSPSHSGSPPELDLDSDSSEDEMMPPSPPTTTVPAFVEKPRTSISTTQLYGSKQEEEQQSYYAEEFCLPQRNPARLISAISVY